jgi:DNA-binding CsgD family transcriptional regulator
MPEAPPVIPGEPVYKEIPATSNKPGEVLGPGKQQPALPAPKAMPALPAPKRSEDEEEDEYELTPREQQIRDRLGRGMSNKEIAAELDLSVKTVENHVNAVLRKLGVSSRTQVTEVHVHLPTGMVQSTTNVQPAAPAEVQVPVTVQPAAVHIAPAIAPNVDVHVAAPDLAPVAEAVRAGQEQQHELAEAVTKVIQTKPVRTTTKMTVVRDENGRVISSETVASPEEGE